MGPEPLYARIPTWSEPGGIGRPSSSSSTARSEIVNVAVSGWLLPGRVMLVAKGPPSLAPSMSSSTIWPRARRPRLASAPHAIPELEMMRTDEMS
jgi:hypothetical protein